MKVSSLVVTISLFSILSVALLSTVPNEASAQLLGFDYRCYTTNSTLPVPSDQIRLRDQFEDQVHEITDSLEFCNPAVKVPEGDPDLPPLPFLPHIRCWDIDSPGGNLMIEFFVLDQFFQDKHPHTLGEAVEFCHTVDKMPGSLPDGGMYDGTMGALTIQNWKCYDITGDPPGNPNRDLIDQFTLAAIGTTDEANFPNATIIGSPILFCANAVKNYNPFTSAPGGDIPSELTNDLICYDIPAGNSIDPVPQIALVDQFTDRGNELTALDKICVDAVKTFPVAGTFIPLNSVMILVAGAQMSAAWVLPALVAVTGIAYGIDIARKYRKDIK